MAFPTKSKNWSAKEERASYRRDVIVFLSGFCLAYMLGLHQQQCETSASNDVIRSGNNGLAQEASSTIAQSTRAPVAAVVVDRKQVKRIKSFYDVGVQYGTDKVEAVQNMDECLKNPEKCTKPGCDKEQCRPWGHYYHTLYQSKLEQYASDSADPFQFLEIGFLHGAGFHTYKDFLSDNAELHSVEFVCKGQAELNPNYQKLLDSNRLHCGDASNLNWLNDLWTTKMRRSDSPPLKVVIDDGSHLSSHMVQSVFFWLPRIEPSGVLIVEDIQPTVHSNLFRTQFLPQVMSDLHYCGDPQEPKDEPCFDLLWSLLQSVHCEMHICVFERNQAPALPDLSLDKSDLPPNALNLTMCYSFMHAFGKGLDTT